MVIKIKNERLERIMEDSFLFLMGILAGIFLNAGKNLKVLLN